MVKTNAARLLDKLGIVYELLEYEVDEEDLSARHVAEANGMDICLVYKTLVLKGDKTDFLVAVIRGDKSLDLKRIAAESGNKRCEMIGTKDLLKVTGYLRGGCSPLGMKKSFPTFVDSDILDKPYILISAGKRGLQMKLSPGDLVRVVLAKVAAISV